MPVPVTTLQLFQTELVFTGPGRPGDNALLHEGRVFRVDKVERNAVLLRPTDDLQQWFRVSVEGGQVFRFRVHTPVLKQVQEAAVQQEASLKVWTEFADMQLKALRGKGTHSEEEEKEIEHRRDVGRKLLDLKGQRERIEKGAYQHGPETGGKPRTRSVG